MKLVEWERYQRAPVVYQPIRGSLSPRKRQLLAVALCRLFPDSHFESWGLAALKAAEQFSEGEMTAAEFLEVSNAVIAANDDLEMRQSIHADVSEQAITAATMILCACGTRDLNRSIPALLEHSMRLCQLTTRRGGKIKAYSTLSAKQADVIRDIAIFPLGSYKRAKGPAAIQLSDGSIFQVPETPRTIASVIHAEQAFDRLPILADALEDAGVSDERFLNHLRDSRDHCRGCWALDLVLGRN